MKTPRSYLALTLIGCGVLYAVFALSPEGRGPIGWTIAAVASAVTLWSLAGLGRRLHEAGGGKAVRHEGRVVTLWLVGVVLIALAMVDTVALAFREERATAGPRRSQ